jgi:hypothetical protein
MIRFFLILFLLYLIIRYVRIAASPRKKDETVQGQPNKPRMQITEDRVSDANFEELPKDDK